MRTWTGAWLMAIGVAACGGGAGHVSVRGDFADAASAPETVVAVEAGSDAGVSRGAFELRGLSAGPATLRLARGADSSAVVSIGSLPVGARLALHGLRVDSASGHAFPRSIDLTGAPVVLVNGIRMAADGRVPATVDARGTVLAVSADQGAILVRPAEATLPDLRVVVPAATQAVTPDGDPLQGDAIRAGDSLRVMGRLDRGYVVASRLTLPRRAAAEPDSGASAADAHRNGMRGAGASSGGDRLASADARGRGEHGRHGRGRKKHHRFLFF